MSQLFSEIRDYIEQHDIQTVSFDVFDTIVFRKLSKPIDVFQKMHDASPDLFHQFHNAAEFRELRQFAEKKAKLNHPSGEVSLHEIYEFTPKHLADNAELMALELATEAKFSFVLDDFIVLIDELLQMSKTVILISDMYLSREQIRETFLSGSETLLSLPLYVSSEFKENKSSGTLFRLLGEKLGIEVNKWLHVGDNLRSDVVSPTNLKISAIHFAPKLDFNRILDMEHLVFGVEVESNTARRLAAMAKPNTVDAASYEIGSVVWGPILVSFADWVINQTITARRKTILCVMREAEVYLPLIKLRLEQRSIKGIEVKKIHVSRKSTFWPSIDTDSPDWFEKLLTILCPIKGYTVADFYRDFYIEKDQLFDCHKEQLLRHSDGVFIGRDNLLKLLSEKAQNNLESVKNYIAHQRELFFAYYHRHVQVEYSKCVTVDLGSGGTAQSQLESIFQQPSAQNLLFFSTTRVYNNTPKTYYSSFINSGNDKSNLRQLLMRSPECIEAFLVGNCGSTIGYRSDGSVIVDKNLEQNSVFVNSFYQGLMAYIKYFHSLGFDSVAPETAIGIVNRYVQLPTHMEANLFTQVCHQDNFGSDKIYPVVDEEQLDKIHSIGVDSFYLQMKKHPRWLVKEIHWPQAALSVISEDFLFEQTGFLSLDTGRNVLELLNVIVDKGWKRFSIYGAGDFFTLLLPHLNSHNVEIDNLIDRKAEISGEYQLNGYRVLSLNQALSDGVSKVVISSLAFKEEITKNIVEQSMAINSDPIEILSL